MLNYACAKKVPDSTKLHLIKGQKTKFPQGSIPRTPLVCHMLCTRMRTCSPNNLYNLIPPPLGQKAELYPGFEIHTFAPIGLISVGWGWIASF